MSVRSGDSSPSKKKAGLSSHSYDHELAEGQHAHLTTAGDVDWDQLPVIPGLVNQTHQRRRPTWMGKVWDTFDAPVEERRLLFKLDAAILTVASLGYCIKNISQTAINNAFVSGMREELGMTGNQLTTAISIFYVGYCVMQLPVTLLLLKVSPRVVIAGLEFIWGLSTLLSMFCKSYKTLYCARFFVGVAEAGYYPGMQFIVGSFYKPQELAKRAVIFHTAGTLGSIFSGALQGSIYRNLNGRDGYAGWRWLFCIIGLISIPIALLSWLFLPQLPGQKGIGTGPTWWLSQADLNLIKKRMDSIGRAPSRKWTKARFLNAIKSWHVWFLPWLYVFWNNCNDASNIWPFWLKYDPKHNWSVEQINNIPNIQWAVAIVSALFWAWSSDTIFRGRRWPPILITGVYNIANCLGLLYSPLYPQKVGGRWYLYSMTAFGFGMSGLIMGWGTELASDSNEKRSLVIGLMNDVAYAVHAAMPNAVWKQTDYPKSTKGLWYSIGLSILVLIWTVSVVFLQRRDLRRAQLEGRGHGDVISTARALGEKEDSEQQPHHRDDQWPSIGDSPRDSLDQEPVIAKEQGLPVDSTAIHGSHSTKADTDFKPLTEILPISYAADDHHQRG